MKIILMIFVLFNFAFMQAKAMNCRLNCAFQETLKNIESGRSNEDHSCCQKKSNDLNKVKESCFHKINFDHFKLKRISPIFNVKEILNYWIMMIPPQTIRVHSYHRLNVIDEKFQIFKADLNLYLLKDQFII